MIHPLWLCRQIMTTFRYRMRSIDNGATLHNHEKSTCDLFFYSREAMATHLNSLDSNQIPLVIPEISAIHLDKRATHVLLVSYPTHFNRDNRTILRFLRNPIVILPLLTMVTHQFQDLMPLPQGATVRNSLNLDLG
uniref:Uncharacterized protein n=1 Tax=Cacopsylla melanoneura TaxID=428564 RepID=A0A8D8LZ49_9HEMI